MPASPLLLGLTTAGTACGAAVWQDGLQSDLTLYRPRRHGERLVPLVRDALAHAEVETGALDAVALAAGPGSYTGLRIGASAAKGLCRATGAAIVPVPTLTALAEAARAFAPPGGLIGAVLRSRTGEVYAAAFRRGEGGQENDMLATVFEAEPLPVEDAAARFRSLPHEEGALRLVGSGAARVAAALWDLEEGAEASPERAAPRVVEEAVPTAAAVARLGAARLAAGGAAPDAAAFEPRYLKPVHTTPRRQSVFEGLT